MRINSNLLTTLSTHYHAIPKMVLIVFIIGILIRLIFAPITAGIYDTTFWASTLDGVNVGKTIYESTYMHYPPVWGYILSFLSLPLNALGIAPLQSAFMDAGTGGIIIENLMVTTIGFNFIYKIPIIIADVLTAIVIFFLVKRLTNDEKKASLCFALWFLCPLALFNGVFKGQFDSIMILMVALSLLMLFKKEYFFAGIFLALGVYTKVFPLLIVPIMIGYILSESTDRKQKFHPISHY